MDNKCISKKNLPKYSTLKERIEADIEIRKREMSEKITLILKRAAKLIEASKLKSGSRKGTAKREGTSLDLETNELYQVMSM